MFKLRDGFEYEIHGSRGVVVTSMMWYPYTAPFFGNFLFVSCFFFIKISGFYVGYVSSVNLEVLTGHGEGFAVSFAIELLPAIPIIESTSAARGAKV